MSTTKIVWLTDIHLNFVEYEARKQFYQSIVETHADAILITGDIAEAHNICDLLTEFRTYINKPIYFVLGNHDYYYGSVISVREKILGLCNQENKLCWLGKPEIINLNKDTILIGHDGWADARYGNFDQSSINLNDSHFIAELLQTRLLNKTALKQEMQRLADADAKILEQTIDIAIKIGHKKIIIATHIPPFPECSWHKNKPCDEYWLPYFSSKAMGDVITAATTQYSNVNFLVLCGHTHTAKIINPYHNLEVKAGSAEYYHPQVQEVIQLKSP